MLPMRPFRRDALKPSHLFVNTELLPDPGLSIDRQLPLVARTKTC